MGRNATPWPWFDSGYWRSNADAMVFKLASALVREMPGFSRPATRNVRLVRSFKIDRESLGKIWSAIMLGIHMSGPNTAFTPLNPGGAMPITVNTMLLIRRVCPTSFGSPPKRSCQMPFARTTTGFVPGRAVFFRHEKAPQHRMQPQHIEIIARHQFAERALRHAAGSFRKARTPSATKIQPGP